MTTINEQNFRAAKQTLQLSWVKAALFSVTYFFCSELDKQFTIGTEPFAPLSLAAGLFLAALLLTERRSWPILLLATFPANMAFYLLDGHSLLTSFLISFSDPLEALTGAWLVQRFVGSRLTLSSLREVWGLLLYGAFLSSTVGATIETAILWFGPNEISCGSQWLLFWGRDSVGILVMVPLLLVWLPLLQTFSFRKWTSRHTEALASLAGFVFVAIFTFTNQWHPNLAIKYLIFPMVVWAAFRFGLAGVTVTSIVTAVVVATFTAHGKSDIAIGHLTFPMQNLAVQLYVLAVAFSGLTITILLSERKQAEERFRAILSTSLDGFWLVDMQGRLLEVNAASSLLTGYSRSELLKMNISDLETAETLEETLEHLQKTREKGYLHFETQHRTKDGRLLDVDVSATYLPENDGRVFVILRDISQRKQIEEALRQSEQRFRTIFEDAPLGIGLVNSQTGAFLNINQAFAEMVGYTRAEMLQTNLQAITHPDDLQASLNLLKQLHQGQLRHFNIDKRYRRKDGAIIWVSLTVVPTWGVGERPTYHLSMVEDITRRKLAEETLRDADHRKDDFLALLGHELRNPLAPILTASQILKLTETTAPQGQQAIAIIERQTTHLSRIVDDLLDVSRIARGKITLCKKRLDWVAVVRSTVEDYRSEFDLKGLTLKVTLPPIPLWIEGDATRLSQIVANLLSNALKFVDSGGTIEIEMRAQPEQATALLLVRDTGIGIEPVTLAKIFEPFVQGASSLLQSRRSGLGLGLALVKGLVELHGGSVNATSPGLGHGTCFSITLPLAETPAMVEADSDRINDKPQPLRILIIEDNLDAAKSLRMFLELKSYTVQMAAEGTSGLATAQMFKPQVILCDIGLPGKLDGYAVARAIRAATPLAPVRLVALTGFGQEEDKRAALNAGFDLHLTKPADLKILERILEEVPRD